MSDDKYAALTAKAGARVATLEEREAWKAEHMRRHAEHVEKLAALVPEKSLAERERLNRRAIETARQDEANRPTIQKYAEYLRLHAKDESRTKAETVHYKALGKRHRWHGRPEHVVFRRDRRPAPTLCLLRRARAPRSRRVRTTRTSHGPPGRSTDGSDGEPDLAPTCPRCGHLVVVLRGVPVCGPCWASTVLALEEWAAW